MSVRKMISRTERSEGAVNLPLEKIEAGETAILKKDQPVYLYCHVGENSRDAAEILEDDGFTTVNLEGGYRTWLRYQLTRVTMEDDSRKERTEQIEKSLIKKFRKTNLEPFHQSTA